MILALMIMIRIQHFKLVINTIKTLSTDIYRQVNFEFFDNPQTFSVVVKSIEQKLPS